MTQVATDVALRTLEQLAAHSFDFATGVPCSLLTGLFRHLESPDTTSELGLTYVPAPREDTAVGIAVGARLGGRTPFVLMQNSGLGYSLNSFTSLTQIYGINPLVLLSWRGFDDTDAVEHDIIGRELLRVLDAVGIGHVLLDPEDPARAIDAAVDLHDDGNRAVAVLITSGV
ncbi:thiamine pyrophosphate-binding protein [Streptomyces prunicolor]|uniref:hypothetical protein n=1 Tax=Streptomyces prunicolor TaxID=67348 RepID=UPI00386612AC|nr:thiamine pyrophosphate-binding protein [Streptomyces prunicolor]